MRGVRVRYLVKRSRSNSTGRHVYYFWLPTKEIQEKWKVQPVALGSISTIAVQRAEELNADLDARRAAAAAAPVNPENIRGSFHWLVARYRKTQKYRQLAESTKNDHYEWAWRLCKTWFELSGNPTVDAVKRRHIKEFYELLAEEDPDTGKPALARAKNVIAALRVLLSYGVEQEVIEYNPAKDLDLAVPDFRMTIWEPSDFAAFEAKAVGENRSSLALAVQIAGDIAQRRADVLAIKWGQVSDTAITIRQNKTGTLVEVPMTAALAAKIGTMTRGGDEDPVIVCEMTGKAWNGSTFTHEFRPIADSAGLIGKWFLDLRRTAVVHMARAGCSIAEITAISGHTVRECTDILERYMPRDSVMALNAIAKVDQHRKSAKAAESRVETGSKQEVETTSGEPEQVLDSIE